MRDAPWSQAALSPEFRRLDSQSSMGLGSPEPGSTAASEEESGGKESLPLAGSECFCSGNEKWNDCINVLHLETCTLEEI